MTKQMTMGKCRLCNAAFSEKAMTKHLRSCKQRAVSETGLRRKIFHLVVKGRRLPEYWMHLEAPADATLEDLDQFLRDTWLECCGHMSAFTIGKTRYIAGAGIDAMWVEIGFVLGGKVGMDVPLGEVLRPGMEFYHEYDFGTTTDLTLRVLSEREGKMKGKSPRILAKNDPPPIPCESCGKAATQVCSECIWSGKGWLCDECADKHKCGEDMLMPVVNSPRVGMCGYTG